MSRVEKCTLTNMCMIQKDNQVLVQNRLNPNWPGIVFPGGKLEKGESPEHALVREIQEELNTTIEVGELIETVEYDYPSFHLKMYCYLCQRVSGQLDLLEHSAAKWLTKATLDSVDWLPADIAVVNKLKEIL